MAERGEVGVVEHVVCLEPPLAEQRCHKRSYESADVDEDVEDLEARVAAAFRLAQGVLALESRLSLEVVVHLTDDSLQVALEQAVAEAQ